MNKERDNFTHVLIEQFAEVPLNRFMGIGPDSFDLESGCIRFDMRDELIGNRSFSILHGGIIAAVLDSEGAFVLALNGVLFEVEGLTTSQPIIKGGTIDLRVDYLRPGRGKRFVASGTILRQGNKVAVVRSELRNETDELIAVGTGTYLVG